MKRLVVPKEIQQLIRKMHPDLKKRGRASLGIIMSEPGSGKALMDELSGLRSFRVRSFRIINDPFHDLLPLSPSPSPLLQGEFRIFKARRAVGFRLGPVSFLIVAFWPPGRLQDSRKTKHGFVPAWRIGKRSQI